jgi:hypothetical protein
MGDPATRQSTSSRVTSGLQSLWNACEAPLTSGKGTCNNDSVSCLIETDTAPLNENDDDDVSILDQSAPPARPPAHQHVRNIVDGILTPFMNCVQPPLDACIAPAMQERDLFFERQSCSRERSMSSRLAPMVTRASVRSSVDSKQNSVTSNGFENNALTARSKQLLPEADLSSTLPEKTLFTRVNVNDVLCGRGNSISKHVGNLNFRDLVDANKGDYNNLTKKEKLMLARQIVDYVMYHTDPPGRFIARDSASGLWYDVGLPRSLEKTSQALREKSAPAQGVAEKVACIRYCVNNVASFEECAPDSIEVENQFQETSAKELSRAVTVKMNNHRNVPIKQPPCIVPEHLQKVYRHERVVHANISAFPTPSVPLCSTDVYQRHLVLQNHGVSSTARMFLSSQQSSHSAALENPSNLLTNDAAKRTVSRILGQPGVSFISPQAQSFANRPLTTSPTFEYSPPRRVLHQPPLTSAAMVTPNGHFSDGFSPSFEKEMTLKTPQERLTETTDCVTESMFPFDVFENPDFSRGADANHDSFSRTTFGPILQQGTSTVSSFREQKDSKRQRLSQTSIAASWDPSYVDLDSPWESLNSSMSKAGGENRQSTQRLAEAIGSQLNLDDLLSPSELLQSYGGGRRRHEPLPRPHKTTSQLDTSADSADGYAALSAAAFLRLDESF